MSSIFNISETQISKLISSLVKKNYIDIRLMYENNSKEIKARIIIPKKFLLEYADVGIKQKLNTSLTNVNKPIQQNCKDNIKYFKNNKYNNNSFEFQSGNYEADFFNSLYDN